MSFFRTVRRLGLSVAVGALTTACQSDTTAPAPRALLAASLVSPFTDDGAVLVQVLGPGIEGIQSAASSYVVYWRLVSATEARVVVAGNLGAGPLFTVTVPDGRQADEYTAVVLDAADRANASRLTIDRYTVAISGGGGSGVVAR